MGLRLGPRLPPWPRHTRSLPLFCALLERRGLRGDVAFLGIDPQITGSHLASVTSELGMEDICGLSAWSLAPKGAMNR